MGNTSVNYVGSRNTAVSCQHTAFNLRNHSAGNCTVLYVAVHVAHVNSLEQRLGIVYITQYTRNIRKLNKFFGLKCNRNFGSRSICIYIVKICVTFFTECNSRNNRNKTLRKKGLYYFGINLRNFPYKTKIGPVFADFFARRRPESTPLSPTAFPPC